MSNLVGVIEEIVQGDDFDVIRTITNVATGQSLADAWLTVREDFWTPVIFSKHITPTLTTDGQITDTGSGDTVGGVRFRLSEADTGSLSPFFTYVYDIQVKLVNGSIYTPEVGTLTVVASITSATS